MDLRKKLIERNNGYKYGRHNLIEDNFEILNLKNSFKINNFLSGISKEGVCNEQHEKYFLDNPDLNLLRVVGSEPKYFNDIFANHFYLLAFDDELPVDFSLLSNKNKRGFVKDNNPYVVDVSFGMFERLKNTDYSIRNFLDKFHTDVDNEFHKAYNVRVSPLGFSKDYLFYLGVRVDTLGIYAQKEGKNSIDYIGSFSDSLSCVDNGSDLGKIISALDSKVIK